MPPALLMKLIVASGTVFGLVMVGNTFQVPLLYLGALVFGGSIGLMPDRWFWRS